MSRYDWESLFDLSELENELEQFNSEGRMKTNFYNSYPWGIDSNKHHINGEMSEPGPRDFGPGPQKSVKKTEQSTNQGNAESLIFDEKEDVIDNTDLQVYQIRRKFTNNQYEEKIEQALRENEIPGLDCKSDSIMNLSAGQRFLQISKELGCGKITDVAQREIAFLSAPDTDADFGMKMFYPLFTLLQSNPSRERLNKELDKAVISHSNGECYRGLKVLSESIKELVKALDDESAKKINHYRSRQMHLDRERETAQNAYNKAHEEADRWRK